MVDHVLVDLDIVTEYIEAAIADPLLQPAERDMMLTLREVPDSVMSLAQFETAFFGINPHMLASLEDTERHLRRREATLHAMESRLRAVAGELRDISLALPDEQEKLQTMTTALHAMADRTYAEWHALHAEWRKLRAREDDLHPKALTYHVFRELYAALCLRDERYGQEMGLLSADVTLLIAAVTRHVARRGFRAAAVAAVVATVLWLVTKFGLRTFCDFYAPHFLPHAT